MIRRPRRYASRRFLKRNATNTALNPRPNKNDRTSRRRGLTNQQIRDVLLLRALQTRGSSRGIQRGVPQFVPYGNPFFMGLPMQGAQNGQQAAAGSSPNRDQARSARAERLRQSREETIAKRQEAARQRAAARANAVKNRARAKPKPADNNPG